MKKLFVIVGLAMVLVSCDRNTVNVSGGYEMPEGLSDCKIYYMNNGGFIANPLYVVRCPMSYTSTTFPVGKSQETVAVVEVDTAGMGEYLRLKEKFGK